MPADLGFDFLLPETRRLAFDKAAAPAPEMGDRQVTQQAGDDQSAQEFI